MISLRKRRARLISEASRLGELFHLHGRPTNCEGVIWCTGLLNHLWQAWCRFWRYYWIAHVQGGRSAGGSVIPGGFSGVTEAEAIYQMLVLLGKRRAGTYGAVYSSHQEATWGDIQRIQDIANALLSHHSNLAHVLSAASLHGQSISHLQLVRNSQVHPSHSGQTNMLSIVPHYLVRSSNLTPGELLYSQEIRSGRAAIACWIDSIVAFAMMIY